MKTPSQKIKAIKNPKSKTADAAHKRLDAVYQYLDENEFLPERIQTAATIIGPMLATGRFRPDNAVKIALETADKILEAK